MPDASPYERSITTANASLAAAVQDYRGIEDAIAALTDPNDTQAAQLKQLTARQTAAGKAWQSAQDAVQRVTEEADKAAVTAKTYAPAGTPRDRLDTTAGNVLVTIREVADGQGGWTLDKSTPITKVDIAGAAGSSDTITAAPTSRMILKNGVLEDNPAWVEPKAATPTGAVPTSEYVYDENGKPVKNVAWVKPKTPEELLTTGQAATDAATARTAEGTAAAALRTAQAGASTAEATLADAQRRLRQSPTDEQAQRAVDTAQKGLDLANQTVQQALDQNNALAKGQIAQQGATLAGTQATTAANTATAAATTEATLKGQQGDLYGLPEKIKQIRDLYAAGQIDEPTANAMLAAAKRGTSVYDVAKQQSSDALTARGQDTTNKGNLTSAYNGLIGSAGTMFGDMNKNGQPGSDASGRAYLAMMDMAQDYLKSYQNTPATPTDYLGTGASPTTPVGNMANLAQQQLGAAPAAPVAPVAPPPPAPVIPTPQPVAPVGMAGGGAADATAAQGQSPAHIQPITINIGGAPAGSSATAGLPVAPTLAPGLAGTAGDPRFNGSFPGQMADPYGSGNVSRLVGAAASAVPAHPDDVAALYPEAAARHRASLGGQF